ncbi:hypothetical protein [Nostoc sp.]|uniref:hypothetical protein n=1 Tax=Nostoc sp. TaxID=1180 RepID=UPI002FF9FA43
MGLEKLLLISGGENLKSKIGSVMTHDRVRSLWVKLAMSDRTAKLPHTFHNWMEVEGEPQYCIGS